MKTWYVCEICGAHYNSSEEAEACEALGRPNYKFAVGDSVWVDGKDRGRIIQRGIWHQHGTHYPEYEVNILDQQGATIDHLICRDESRLQGRVL